MELVAAATTEDEFRLIADSAPVPIWVTRLDRTRGFVNRAYVDFLGVGYEESLVFDWRTILHPDDAERVRAESIAGEASLQTFTLEGRYRRGDGEWRWLQSVSQPRRDASGEHIGFIGVAHDITEAKTAEHDLREREAQLSAFVNQTTAGLAQVDLAGRFTLVNDRFCEITGRTREALLATTMQAITHTDDLPANVEKFDAAVRDGAPYIHEKRYVRPDGTSVWVNNSVAVIRRADGEPYGVLAVTLDITARRAAEDALRRSEENVRLAVERAGMATWELDLRTMEGPWSLNRFDLLGYPRAADARGTFGAWLERLHPDDREAAEAAARRCFTDGVPFEIVYRILRADTGDVRWLQSHGSRIEGEDGRPVRFVGVSFDITAARRQQEELERNAERLAFLDTLGRAAAAAPDVDAVLGVTTRMLGEQLGGAICAYADVEVDERHFTIRGNWTAPGAHDLRGHYDLSAFGERTVTELRAGRTLIVNDIAAELGDDAASAFGALGIAATIVIPLVRQDRLTAMMAVHADAPRRWTQAELALLAEVAERSWAHIERARTAAALRESEGRLRLAIEGGKIGTWDWDLVDETGSWSPRAAEILGMPGEQVTVQNRFTLVHPEDRAAVLASIAEVVAHHDQFSREYRIIRPDGAVRWVASRGIVIRDGEGRAVRTTGTLRDVTDRREAQEKLAALNRTLEETVTARTAERDRMWRSSRDLLLIVGRRQEIRAVNPALAALGYQPEALIGRRVTDFIHAEDQAIARVAMRASNRAPLTDLVARIRAADGTWHAYAWTANPGEGEAYVVGRDVTAEIERRRELERAQEALRQSQKVEALGQLTGGVAHDFNNLLTPIIGSLDLLSRNEARPRERRLLDGALEAADRARTLVQRLLAFARRQPLQPGPVDLALLIEGMGELIATTLGPTIAVTLDLPHDLAAVNADANQLEMAILNLCVNARDAMPAGGTLTVSATTEILAARADGTVAGQYVLLSIHDDGVGMSEEVLARAIEPFFSTKGLGRGTGLGLSMVHGLASQLGGTMRIASTPGAGTTVTLVLPLSARAAAPALTAELLGAGPLAGSALLVDDDDAVRAAGAEMLRTLGLEVSEVASAEAAVERLARQRFDYLVTDHLMPGMSGSDLARVAYRLQPDLKVLVVSGYAQLEGIPNDLRRLPKPFRLEELSDALRALMV